MRTLNQVRAKSFYVISAERLELSKSDNFARTNQLVELLKAYEVPFKPIVGMYNDKAEKSFIVDSTHINVDNVLKLGRDFNQDSIIYVNEGREGFTTFTDNSLNTISLGKLTEVSEREAYEGGNFSYDPQQDRYYVFRK